MSALENSRRQFPQETLIRSILIPRAPSLADQPVLSSHLKRWLIHRLLTFSVVGAYTFTVGVFSLLFHTHGNLIMTIIGTGAVAVLFQPLRIRLQRGVNRLMYGERDDPYTVLSRLGERLTHVVDSNEHLPLICQTVAQALKLPYVAIALKEGKVAEYGNGVRGNGGGVSKGVADKGKEVMVWPLVYQGEQVGELWLAPRSVGEPFAPADHRLLHDLARQIGVAAKAVQLAMELQASRLQIVAERETARRRLGSDLHDGLGHRLAGVLRKVEKTTPLLTHDLVTARQYLEDTAQQTRGIITDVRALSHSLHPPELELLGLVGALRERVQQLCEPGGLQVNLEVVGEVNQLPIEVESAVYYMALEALSNVQRHARAQHCWVWLGPARGERLPALTILPAPLLELEICDDGQGVPTKDQSGLGVASMRKRAAEIGGVCVVEQRSTGGHCVRVLLPVVNG